MPDAKPGAGYNPANNTVSIGDKTVGVPHADAIASSFGAKALEIKDKAIAYNPKMNPKYDPRASVGAQAYATGSALYNKPRADKGLSLVGHELTHVVQQR